jgi:type IV secretory pathway TraG/TraD family ATPase VirD4
MDEFYLGRTWNPVTGRIGGAVYADLDDIAHGIIMAPTSGGKGATIEIPNRLLDGLRNVNLIGIDPTGQNSKVTCRWRSAFSDYHPLNPLNLHDLGDVGCNPLLSVKTFEDAMRVGEAAQELKPSAHEPFFAESSVGLIAGASLAEVRDANGKRTPTLPNVRRILTGDVEGFAAHMAQSGDHQLESLLGRFQKENRTIDAIKQTADNATKWMLSEAVAKSLSVEKGIDWTQLKNGPRPLTIELILPAEGLVTFAPWLRLIYADALNAVYQLGGGGRKTVFSMSEFYAWGKLGPSFTTAMTQGRKYGARFFPIVLQNVDQLPELFGPHGSATVLGNSGALLAFAPAPTDNATAEFLSKAAGSHWVPSYSASDDPQGGPARITIGEREERLWSPERIRSLPKYHALLFMEGAQPQPVWLPRYFKPLEFPELQGRYDADPYHPSASSPAPMSTVPPGGNRRVGVAFATAVAAALAATALLSHGASSRAHYGEQHLVRTEPPAVFHHHWHTHAARH